MAARLARAQVDGRKAAKFLAAAVKRLVPMMRSIKNPDAPALGVWSVTDVAVHLSQAWIAVPGLANDDLSEIHAAIPDTRSSGRSLIPDLWSLGGVTKDGVRGEPERDITVLAGRIEERARAYLAAHGNAGAAGRRPWLVEGTEVAPVTLTCHLLSETIMHGWDMATADGQRWDIPADHAAMVFDGFLMTVLQTLGPRDMVNQESAAGLVATFNLRVKGGNQYVFAFDDGALTIDPPGSQPIDCIVDADPVALLLVAWGREDQAKAIKERKLVPSGPKAHLAPRLRLLMRNP